MIHPDSLIWIKPRHGSHAKEGTLESCRIVKVHDAR